MQIDLKRKVKEINLQPPNFLYPLFELVVNAIQAIEETNSPKGEVKITVVRDHKQQTIPGVSDPPIDSFIVEDNGIGFNKDNFAAFKVAYTKHKVDIGGKGIGRFTILKAFKRMNVQSSYKDQDGCRSRSFTFDLDNEVEERDASGVFENGTGSIIAAENYRDEFKAKTQIPLKYVARELVEYLLLYFMSGHPPKISLQEEVGQQVISLNDVFQKDFYERGEEKEPDAKKGEQFKLYIVKSKNKEKSASKYKLCANKRKVKGGFVNTILPFFPESESIYIYVTGDYLDKHVNEVRDELNIPDSSRSESDIICQDDINEIICEIFMEVANG